MVDEVANEEPAGLAERPSRWASASRLARSLIAVFVTSASYFALGIFVFSLLGRYFFYAELLGNFRLQLAIALGPIALLNFAIKRWLLALSLTLAVLWNLLTIGVLTIPKGEPSKSAQSLRIMSYNVLAQNQRCPQVLECIHEQDPDVVVVLEYANHWHTALGDLTSEYPYQCLHPRWHGFGAAIFSKYPLSNERRVDLLPHRTDSPMPIVDIEFGDQRIRLAAVHVISPMNRYRLELRNQQFEEIAVALADQSIPTVVVGDFNCTPWSPFLRDFLDSTGFADSRSGFGYQGSWHSYYWFLSIPIDHAFVSAGVNVHRRKIGRTAGSDHFPIVVDISLE